MTRVRVSEKGLELQRDDDQLYRNNAAELERGGGRGSSRRPIRC